jgi:hypothetical protein
MRRHKKPAQAIGLVAVMMVAMIGALSMVIDAGVYFVIERQLQNAADAAALAAVWHGPPCQIVDQFYAYGCQDPAAGSPDPATVVANVVEANSGVALSLCAGPNLPAGTVPVNISSGPGPALIVPSVNTYVVTVSCDAPHWFARIFPTVRLQTHISRSAAAAVGWRGPNGELLGGSTPRPPLVARLIL